MAQFVEPAIAFVEDVAPGLISQIESDAKRATGNFFRTAYDYFRSLGDSHQEAHRQASHLAAKRRKARHLGRKRTRARGAQPVRLKKKRRTVPAYPTRTTPFGRVSVAGARGAMRVKGGRNVGAIYRRKTRVTRRTRVTKLTYHRRRKPTMRKMVAKAVRQAKKAANRGPRQEYRTMTFDSLAVANNQCAYEAYDMNTGSQLESRVSAIKKVAWDSTTAAADVVDMDYRIDGPDKTRIHFPASSMVVRVRNNSSSNLMVKFYTYTAAQHTADPVDNIVASHLGKRGVTSGATDLQWWPKDATGMGSWWKRGKRKPMLASLAPGQEVSYKLKCRRFYYRPEDFDDDNSDYRKNISQSVLVRAWGTVAHDSTNTTTEIGTCNGTLDVQIERRWAFYPENYSKTYFVASTNAGSAFSNASIQYGQQVQELSGVQT